jgi:hypothetical protein
VLEWRWQWISVYFLWADPLLGSKPMKLRTVGFVVAGVGAVAGVTRFYMLMHPQPKQGWYWLAGAAVVLVVTLLFTGRAKPSPR